MWEICGERLESGEKREVMLHPFGMEYDIPATLICGAKSGMTMLVTAQIHAGEYIGSAAVMRLSKEINPLLVTGNIILMHCVNTSGFKTRQRRFVPEDRANLNANFPGCETGTTGNKIAAWFVKEVFPYVDFICDLHNGKDNDKLESCVFYPRAAKVNEVSFNAAKALNVDYLLASSNCVGLYGYAANHFDIPGMIIERGCGCVLKEEWVENHKENVYRLLKHFNMYNAVELAEVKPAKVYKYSAYLTLDKKGVWNTPLSIGQRVKKGDLLGTITDFFGNEIKSYYAVGDGEIIYFIAGLCVLEGDEVIAYGLDAPACDKC